MTDFQSLNLAAPVAKALKAEGYETPTPIQSQAIPPALEGRDILGVAQTGTGKTAAFSLPLLDRLARDRREPEERSARVLVLAPTRELAAQIAEAVRGYGVFLAVRVEAVFGGVPSGKQAKKLKNGVDILVATPGRLLDLVDQNALRLDRIEALVLDEADQMMDLGFIHPLKKIVRMLPRERQTMFFSATMPKAIEELADQFVRKPVRVSVAPQATTAERVAQSVIFAPQKLKPAILARKLSELPVERAIVFTRTKHGADRVVRQLGQAGIDALAIHGNKTQSQRQKALAAFRSARTPILVATDIAARGIDVSGVSHVFNYELPNVPEQYVHRIGRTARAGAEGVAISLCANDERAYMKAIERTTRQRVPSEPIPQGLEIPEEPANEPREDRPTRGDGRRPDARNRSGRPRRSTNDGRSGVKQDRSERPVRAERAAADAAEQPPRNTAERSTGQRQEGAGTDQRPPRKPRPAPRGHHAADAPQDRPTGKKPHRKGQNRRKPADGRPQRRGGPANGRKDSAGNVSARPR
ncbi:MAG: DEAD/DEAH box helicase [Pseudomonadota bacterium]